MLVQRNGATPTLVRATLGRDRIILLIKTGLFSAERGGKKLSTHCHLKAEFKPTEISIDITSCVHNATRYTQAMLQSFGDKDTERVWHRTRVKKFHGDLQRVALRKLAILDAAEVLADLRVPPGNRLEKLSGDRTGQHSIRVNDQWRICFRWTKAGPEEVAITDYH